MPLRDLWRQYESDRSAAERDPEKYPDVIRSLAVKPVYASHILSGAKSWEIRRKHTHVRERVAIYASSTKHMWGTVAVQNCVWKQMAELELSVSVSHHGLTLEELQAYGLTNGAYVWVLAEPRVFELPVRWVPPVGAVVWSYLPDDLRQMVSSMTCIARSQDVLHTKMLDMKKLTCEDDRDRRQKRKRDED